MKFKMLREGRNPDHGFARGNMEVRRELRAEK
jgi:hypothetical protein